MKLNVTIGFIGGGRMAEALIKGILSAGLVSAQEIFAADPDSRRREVLEKSYGVHTTRSNASVIKNCAVVILAVKPQSMESVLEEIKTRLNSSHLVISIAAGIPLSLLEVHLAATSCRTVRVMPNTPALVQAGASALSGGMRATPADLTIAQTIFGAVGQCVVVEEQYLDAVTGLSGSGPAYVFAFIEALVDAGVKVGLARDLAQTLVLQTILGSVKLAMETGQHPAQLRAMVTSPGGTTIAGLHQLARAGFAGIVMDAVEAATNRSMELGGRFQTGNKAVS